MVRTLIIAICFVCLASTTWAAAWFTDGFESGDLTHTENGANWFEGSYPEATVSSTVARTGTYSARFRYASGVNAEQRFDLGANKTDVWIRYYVYFPANYTHKTTTSYNDKFIRLWSDNSNYTGDRVKVGSSLYYDSAYKAQVVLEAYETYPDNLSCSLSGTSMDVLTSWGHWHLTADDLERWIEFKFHFKVDSGAGDGALEMYVDGVKQIGDTSLSWASAPCANPYFRTGYLFGYAYTSAILTENMDIYVDDFTLSDTDPGSGDTPATPSPGLTGVTTSGITIR